MADLFTASRQANIERAAPLAARMRPRRLADYVVFMYMGEMVEHGPAKQVFANPREDRTRAYLKGELY